MPRGGEEAIGVGGKDEYVNGLLFKRDVGKSSWNVGGSSTSTAPVGRTVSWEFACCNADGVVMIANGLDCFLPLHTSLPKSTVESCSEEGNTAFRSTGLDTTESDGSCPPPFCPQSERELRGSTKRSGKYNGLSVSLDIAPCRCSAHPASSELEESRRATVLILSEAIRPRRVSRGRLGEDKGEDFDLLLKELVEYRRARRPLWDMGVSNSEPEVLWPITVSGVPRIRQSIPTSDRISESVPFPPRLSDKLTEGGSSPLSTTRAKRHPPRLKGVLFSSWTACHVPPDPDLEVEYKNRHGARRSIVQFQLRPSLPASGTRHLFVGEGVTRTPIYISVLQSHHQHTRTINYRRVPAPPAVISHDLLSVKVSGPIPTLPFPTLCYSRHTARHMI